MQYLSDRPAGPSGGRVQCTACGKILDPLRAGHVAIFNSQFHFFCDRAVCRARFVGKTEIVKLEPTPAPTPVRRDLDAVLPPVRAAVSSSHETEVPERLAIDDPADLTEPIESLILEAPMPEPEGERRDVGALLVALTLIAGVLTMALELAGPTRLVQAARVVLLAVGTAALFGRAFTSTSDPSKPHRLVTSLAPLAATALAGASLLAGRVALTAQATFLAGTVLTVAAVNLWLVAAAERRVDKSRRWLMQRLNVPGRRVTGEVTAISPKEVSFDLRPSEHLVVEAGESVPVDLVIVEGEVEVLPCVGPQMRVRRQPGDPVVAGSRVVHGQLRGACTWAGDERALARPMLAAARRSDVHADLPRLARRLAERWALVLTVIAAVAAVLLGHRLSEVSLAVVAVYAAFGNVAVGSLAALAVALGVDAALRRGVVYNTADGWEKCSRVTAAVFCARGTLLKGEPELVEIEVFERGQRGASAEHVLALAAGALAAERNPVAVALRRAARDRGLAAAPVRNTRAHAGFGVVAVGQSGEAVCVGSRALLLERKISVAVAEQKIYELETSGRTVVLVARAGRLLGLCALQDGLRVGARASVQHVLDAKIEPVLMSADTRDTCEALGRALDIDHLRSEVHDDERAGAVQRIKDTGATVAVLGHTPYDDEALMAADAAVVLGVAGRERDEFAVSLVTDDVRDAALALALAHRTRAQAAWVLALCVLPAAFGALVVAIGLLPAAYAPLAQLLGAAAAVGHLRSYARDR